VFRYAPDDDAGDSLVTWLEETRAEHERSRSEIASLSRAVDALGKRMDAGFAKVDDRFARVDERLSALQVAIADSKAELMKWMLVFWVGAVGAIAALAGVLRS
jgi:hypothetical protein